MFTEVDWSVAKHNIKPNMDIVYSHIDITTFAATQC
jgi:hypothetical protein